MALEAEKARDMWARYTYLRDNGHLDYAKKAVRCEDFFAGRQWDPNDLNSLRAQRRPAITINKILNTMSNVFGEQIFNRLDVGFVPRNGEAQQEVADALSKVFMQIADNNQLAWLRSEVFADGCITSRGYYDVRMDFGDSLRGEVRITLINPRNVLPDSDADDYDPDTWSDVMITQWMSADTIELKYGKDMADALFSKQTQYFQYNTDALEMNRDRFGMPSTLLENAESIGMSLEMRRSLRTIRVLDRQWRKLKKTEHFVNIYTGDMRPVPADWDREKISKYLASNPAFSVIPKITNVVQWTVAADDIVMHDELSPYSHFTVIPYFPYFRRGDTIGLVENLLGPQEMLNKVSSQELHVVNTTANSGWMVKRGALQNMSIAELEQRGAETGLVLELDDVASMVKIQPNATPQGLDRMSYKAEEHIKTIAGVSDYQTGNPREDVSAKAVKANQSQGTVNLAKAIDNLSRTDYILGRNVLKLIQQYYTEERLIFITQDRLLKTNETIAVNQPTPEGTILNDLTLGEYGIVITTQPERETFEDSQFDQAVRLRNEAAVNIPDKFIIKSSRLKDKAEIITAIEGDKNSPEAQAQAQLQMRAQEAEVAKAEAEVQQKQMDAQLKGAKSQTEQMNVQDPMMEFELKKQQFALEMEIERQKMDLERQKMEMEMQLKQQSAQMDMQIKMQTAQQDAEIKAQTAQAQIEAQKQAAMTQRVQAVHGAPTQGAKKR